MEDFLYTLITIGFTILAIVVNKRRIRTENAESEEKKQPEILNEPHREILPNRKIATKRVKRQGSTLHPDSQEQIVSEIQTTKHHPALQSHHTEPTGPKKQEKHSLTTDFDIRKAIIWSEILHPKFDEE